LDFNGIIVVGNLFFKKLLKVPDEYEVVVAPPLGYPTADVFTEPRNRKNLDEIVSVNKVLNA